ncbi:hypothetical protein KEM56_005056 [Ascosphaera pollenicola]|nr:hypothetical protein KEM56_005056 [Ascosphaera pollenicola]
MDSHSRNPASPPPNVLPEKAKANDRKAKSQAKAGLVRRPEYLPPSKRQAWLDDQLAARMLERHQKGLTYEAMCGLPPSPVKRCPTAPPSPSPPSKRTHKFWSNDQKPHTTQKSSMAGKDEYSDEKEEEEEGDDCETTLSSEDYDDKDDGDEDDDKFDDFVVESE